MHAMSPDVQLALYPLFFVEDRHDASDVCRSGDSGGSGSNPNASDDNKNQNIQQVSCWRMKDRMKTMSVALVMCLNIGVDPPDVLKIAPCARLECWINPLLMQPAKALEAIGKALQQQYERWQPRAKYKLQLDPTVEDVKKLCLSCRRNAKHERVLLHYNGHGVPRPTVNGEIWVFNKSYTQYIPLSVFDLQQWTGNPAIYVFDCGGAGVVVDAFLQLAQSGGLGRGGFGASGVGTTNATKTNATTPGVTPTTTNVGHGTAPNVSGGHVPGTHQAYQPVTGGAQHGTVGTDTATNQGTLNTPVGVGTVGTGTPHVASPVAAVASSIPSGSPTPTMGGAMPLGAGMSEVILLAACGADETLPQSAELPADVFSACLTTPIKIALQWFCSRSILKHDGVDAGLIDQIPGQQNNRKTPLGELNWIFTAVTDTIAWNALPRPLFQRLFRQDLLVASLFRNFLLAERVMRASNCTPVSCPAMPPTYQHPMWHAWDAAVETCLLQMPGLITGEENNSQTEFTPSPFFTEQLTAFEVWLERGSSKKPPPEQLPIVLQVLLSQSHRLRALVLLGRFLDMGQWAVDLALSVGIFPYVLKLLQTTAPDLRQILVFIWTKILALDASCQADLVKDGGHAYFARFLDTPNTPSEERAMAAFVLTAVCDNHKKGQQACASSGVLRICLQHLPNAAGPTGSPLLVRWLCLCMGKLWENVLDSTKEAFAIGASDAVASLLQHPTPDARAAAVFALGALVYVPEEGTGDEADTSRSADTASDRHDDFPEFKFGNEERLAAERAVACQILPGVTDASPVVRAETATALGRLACAHSKSFVAAAEWYAKVHSSSKTSSSKTTREIQESQSSRDFGKREGSMRALDEREEETGDEVRSGQVHSSASTATTVPNTTHRSPPTSPTRHRGHNMGAFGSSTSLASAGSTGSLGGLAGSQGRNAGVYAASEAGPFEPAFGSGPEYRDPRVAVDLPVGDGVGDASVPGDSEVPSYGSQISQQPETSPQQNVTYASADAARVGGGLYWHLLQRLAELSMDPSPRVAVTAQRSLLATGLDPSHPLLKPVVGREALRSAMGKQSGGAEGDDDGLDTVGGLGNVSGRRFRNSSPREPTGESPFGAKGRSSSWHQKLSAAAARLLGSPGRKSSQNRGESVSGGVDAVNSLNSQSSETQQLRRSNSALRIMSPLASNQKAMKRVATAHAPLREGGEMGRLHHPGFDNGSNQSSPRAGGSAESNFFSTAPFSLDSSERRKRAMPVSLAFSRAREHFGRSLLEPPAGAHGYEQGYDDDEEDFGVGSNPPTHRRLDPEKRFARRRVFENRSRQAGRAIKEQLKLPDYIGGFDSFRNGAVPSCVLLHPLTPTLVATDLKGQVNVWDYNTNRKLHCFDAGLPAKRITHAGLINDLDDAVLWTSGVDGSVRVWRDFMCPGRESLVAAVRALPLPSIGATTLDTTGGSASQAGSSSNQSIGFNKPPTGLQQVPTYSGKGKETYSYPSHETQTRHNHFFHKHKPRTPAAVVWQQQSGCLYASGDTFPVPLLRVWDMTRELCLESLQTQSPGTCLTAEGALLMAGALDGAVMSFDLRTPARLLSVVQTHASSVVSILLQPGNVGNLVVTGGTDGEMKFCDLRNSGKPFHTADAFAVRSGAMSGSTNGGGSSSSTLPTARGSSSTSGVSPSTRTGPHASTNLNPSFDRTLTSLVAHDSARVVASASTECVVKLWDLEGNPTAFVKQRNTIGVPRCLAFHPNQIMLGVGSSDGVASVYSGEMRRDGLFH